MGSKPLSEHQPAHFRKCESYDCADLVLQDLSRSLVALSERSLPEKRSRRQATWLVEGPSPWGSLLVSGSDLELEQSAWGCPITSPGALDTRSDPSTLVLPEGAELADGELNPILCR